MCALRPRRTSAARATTTAPSSPARATRRSMLPRSGAKTRSGRAAASCARRRTEPVPTHPPVGSAASDEPTSASRGSCRSGTAASVRPGGSVLRRSLAEWTARSARRSSNASSTSFTNAPVPPSCSMGAEDRVSPVVRTTTSSYACPSRSPTCRACQRARRLPRVAMRTGRPIGSLRASAHTVRPDGLGAGGRGCDALRTRGRRG